MACRENTRKDHSAIAALGADAGPCPGLQRRVALAARHLVYGEASVLAGPVAASVSRKGRDIAVAFKDVTEGLASVSGAPTAFELCAKTQESCKFVPTRI